MEQPNYKISGFQLGIITFFITGGLFVGMGIICIFSIDAHDAWIATLFGIIGSIIPVLLIIYLMSYQPEKNIFEKNKIIFGKLIGTIVNLVLTTYVGFMVLITLWSNTSFAITIYLTKTPEYFVAGIFLLAAIYAISKGLEPIARMSEILFFLTLIILTIIIASLYMQVNMDYFKPLLINGILPVIRQSLNFTSYLTTPLIMLAVIPKKNIIKSKNTKWWLMGGVFMGIMLMFAVFFLIPGVITPELAQIYRFPAYYVQRKISIGGVINNLENFLTLHWFFDTFLLIVMGMYFIFKFIENIFNIKKTMIKNIVILIIGILFLFLRGYIFPDSTASVQFMRYQFPLYISGTMLILILIICLAIFIKKHTKKAST